MFVHMAGDAAHESGLTGVLGNGVTTWFYSKLYSRQRIISVQLLPMYNQPTGRFTINTCEA